MTPTPDSDDDEWEVSIHWGWGCGENGGSNGDGYDIGVFICRGVPERSQLNIYANPVFEVL